MKPILWNRLINRLGFSETPPAFEMTPWQFADVQLIAHWDPSDPSGVLATGDDLTRLNDLSGNSHHLTPPGTNPKTGTRTLNGLNAIEFNSNYIESSNFAYAKDGNQLLVFAVEIENGSYHDCIASCNEATKWWNLKLANNDQSFTGLYQTESGNNTATDPADKTLQIISVFQDATNKIRRVYRNGDLLCINFDITGPLTSGVLRFSATNVANAYVDKMVLGEAILTGDIMHRQALEKMLAIKYGILDKFPDSYPYREDDTITCIESWYDWSDPDSMLIVDGKILGIFAKGSTSDYLLQSDSAYQATWDPFKKCAVFTEGTTYNRSINTVNRNGSHIQVANVKEITSYISAFYDYTSLYPASLDFSSFFETGLIGLYTDGLDYPSDIETPLNKISMIKWKLTDGRSIDIQVNQEAADTLGPVIPSLPNESFGYQLTGDVYDSIITNRKLTEEEDLILYNHLKNLKGIQE